MLKSIWFVQIAPRTNFTTSANVTICDFFPKMCISPYNLKASIGISTKFQTQYQFCLDSIIAFIFLNIFIKISVFLKYIDFDISAIGFGMDLILKHNRNTKKRLIMYMPTSDNK